MPSLRARLVNYLISRSNTRQFMVDLAAAGADGADRAAVQAVVDRVRAGSDLRAPDQRITRGFTHETIAVDGFDLHLLTRPGAQRVALVLAGGAYVVGPSAIQWRAFLQLPRRTGCDLALFDYPKAPEHTAAVTVARTVAAVERLIARYGAANVTLVGESAGGGLALAVLMQLRDAGRPQPRAAALIYPWLDVTLSHPEAAGLEPVDPVLTCAGLRVCGRIYAGELPTDDPRVSPWFGSAAGLAPLHILTGTRDVLHPEAVAFAQRAQTVGQAAQLTIYDGMLHAWMLMPVPEAGRAWQAVAALVG